MPLPDFNGFVTPQSALDPQPVSIVGAATVTVTSKLTVVTGTGTAIATITPPFAGYHELIFVFTNATPNTFSAAGNIQRAVTPLQNIPVLLAYDPRIAKYYAISYAS